MYEEVFQDTEKPVRDKWKIKEIRQSAVVQTFTNYVVSGCSPSHCL